MIIISSEEFGLKWQKSPKNNSEYFNAAVLEPLALLQAQVSKFSLTYMSPSFVIATFCYLKARIAENRNPICSQNNCFSLHYRLNENKADTNRHLSFQAD